MAKKKAKKPAPTPAAPKPAAEEPKAEKKAAEKPQPSPVPRANVKTPPKPVKQPTMLAELARHNTNEGERT